MAILIKRADWKYYQKYKGYTKEEKGKKYLLFQNGIEDKYQGWQEVEILTLENCAVGKQIYDREI